MKLLTFVVAGVAIAAGIAYITRERENGSSILDDLTENAPKWLMRGKEFATQTINNVTEDIRRRNAD